MHTGGCHCGAVRFRAATVRPTVTACHCGQCRAWSGHVWGSTVAPLDGFTLTEARGLRWFRSSDRARRGFCGDCGASLFWQAEGEDQIALAAGAMDRAEDLTHGRDIFVADAGDYYAPDGPPPAPQPCAGRLAGRCLCGACRFEAPGPMGAVTACHCDQCRRLSGYHSASFDLPESVMIWHARQALREYRTPGGAARGYCGDCGSSLYFRAADGAFSVEAGGIAAPTGGRLVAHIFAFPAVPYLPVADGLPHHPAWAPSDPA